MAWFLAKDGDITQAEINAKAAFTNILKKAKGDFDTRLWLFYDAYIYGETMMMCGNEEEAKHGYQKCIDANPFTGLAKQAKEKLRRLLNETN